MKMQVKMRQVKKMEVKKRVKMRHPRKAPSEGLDGSSYLFYAFHVSCSRIKSCF